MQRCNPAVMKKVDQHWYPYVDIYIDFDDSVT